jgi:acetyl-CoA C-acetyltransferase
VWDPVARPDLTGSPGIAAAAGATLDAAGLIADDVDLLDLYSCFPAAIEAATSALGLAADDPRGLTVTGGLPYFGGPGNNYSTHAIATLTDGLRHDGTGTGLVGALGWYTTKHAYGLYGAAPPPRGFRHPDTTDIQRRIDDTAIPVAANLKLPVTGTIAAATIVYGNGGATAAPAFVTLDDGRRIAAAADPAQLPSHTDAALVGCRARVAHHPPIYEVLP